MEIGRRVRLPDIKPFLPPSLPPSLAAPTALLPVKGPRLKLLPFPFLPFRALIRPWCWYVRKEGGREGGREGRKEGGEAAACVRDGA